MKTSKSPSSNIVPENKHDLEACDRLSLASNDEVAIHVDMLLACLQDLNWPIAAPVSDRLAMLDYRLITPVQKILLGNDETWKYWIISYLLHHVDTPVLEGLRFTLNRIASSPTRSEMESEVASVALDLMQTRPISAKNGSDL